MKLLRNKEKTKNTIKNHKYLHLLNKKKTYYNYKYDVNTGFMEIGNACCLIEKQRTVNDDFATLHNILQIHNEAVSEIIFTFYSRAPGYFVAGHFVAGYFVAGRFVAIISSWVVSSRVISSWGYFVAGSFCRVP
jgi:hypothetical protein